jgi:hypothetical protein
VSGLAVMLVAMGIADVCRRLTHRLWVAAIVAPVVVVGCAALAGLWHLGDIALLVIAAVASAGWPLLCARAEQTGEHETAPLVLFGVAAGVLIVLSGWSSDVRGVVARWPSWVGLAVDADRLLMIVGLALAGQLAAATAVVAAKSIIRFPEINAQKARENGGIGIDEVTEYFLVGSFASWILALGGVALAQ